MLDFHPDYFLLLIQPLLLPSFISLFILARYWKDDVSKYIGLMSIKPVIAYPIWFFISTSDWINQVYDLKPILTVVVPLIPAVILTLVIVYFFRHLFPQEESAKVFLIGDIVRWLNTFVFSAFPSALLFSLMYFGLIFPSLYAIGGLIIVVKRSRRERVF